MEKVKAIVNSWWFKSALYGGLATALFIKGEVFYAGIAIGAGLRELFLAFKQDNGCGCNCDCCKSCDKCGDKMLKS